MCAGFPGISSRCESCESQARFEEPQLRELHAAASDLQRYLVTALPGSWWVLQCHTLLKSEELLLWGLVLSLGPGSKHETTEQEDLRLGRPWIVVGISLELSVLMTLKAFKLQFWSLDFSFPEKECLVLSCPVLYKFIISFYCILLYLICFL